MPRKELSPSELLEIVQQGGKVSREHEPSVVPEGFTQLMDQLKEVISSHRKSIQQQNELSIQAVKQLTEALNNFHGDKVDLKPIESLVKQLMSLNSVEKPEYHFGVERNGRGMLTGITAKIIKPTMQ